MNQAYNRSDDRIHMDKLNVDSSPLNPISGIICEVHFTQISSVIPKQMCES